MNRQCIVLEPMKTRTHESAFLTQLDRITTVHPKRTKLVRDDSGIYSRAKLFLGAQLREMPLPDLKPVFEWLSELVDKAYEEALA